jgi:hypothetical protein
LPPRHRGQGLRRHPRWACRREARQDLAPVGWVGSRWPLAAKPSSGPAIPRPPGAHTWPGPRVDPRRAHLGAGRLCQAHTRPGVRSAAVPQRRMARSGRADRLTGRSWAQPGLWCAETRTASGTASEPIGAVAPSPGPLRGPPRRLLSCGEPRSRSRCAAPPPPLTRTGQRAALSHHCAEAGRRAGRCCSAAASRTHAALHAPWPW